ncbi:hypothetical protein OAU50_00530 [Planctomycetota bacterium]|nr:hypothetical protein [Planctomycetota bacterium]
MIRLIPALLLAMTFVVPTTFADDKQPETEPKSESDAEEPIQLGRIDWKLGLDDAAKQAKELERPMLVLFQDRSEASKTLADHALTHFLIKEAAENLFVPVVITDDQKLVKKHQVKEFPALRILNSRKKNIIKPAKETTPATFASDMIAALEDLKVETPGYLELALSEVSGRSKKTELAVFEMF